MPFHFLPRSFRDMPRSAIILPVATLAIIAAIVFWGDFVPVQSWLKLPRRYFASAKSGAQPLKERTSRVRGVVQQGQTLSGIMEGFQLSPSRIAQLIEAARPYYDLGRLHAGNEYFVVTGEHGELRGFEYYIDVEHLLKVAEKNGTFTAELLAVPFTIKAAVREGTVALSLIDSLASAGVDAKLARDFAGIFEGEVDFAVDLAPGATWRMLYEEKWRDGKVHEAGRILAAEIVNKGRKYAAIYFGGAAGKGDYYTPAGETVRRMFLKSPVRNKKAFAVKEAAPLRGQKKSQFRSKTAELDAPSGTPVEALADGRVISTGTAKGRRGKSVVLRHQGGYETRYAPLSGLARGVQRGARVKQGTVIGYVGASGGKGRSYLEFEMQKGKRPVDPLSMPDLPARQLDTKEMQRFRELLRERVDLMAQVKTRAAAPAGGKAGDRELP